MSDQPPVGLVGDGPAVEAVRAALTDGDHETTAVDPADADTPRLVVVAAPAGDERFSRVNGTRDGPWLAVELGGIGGLAVEGVDAGLAALARAGPCYDCLAARVRSTQGSQQTGPPTLARPEARLAGAHAGRLALRILDDPRAVGTVVELPHTRRRLYPVPGCACDAGRTWTLNRDHEAVDLEATMVRAEAAVDDRLGPVMTVGEAESFPAPYYLASVADTRGFSDARASQQAAGVAADWNPAFVKAVGEALERYSAGVYRTASFVTAPAADLDDAVAPSAFVRPDSGEAEPGATDPIDWLPGEDLRTGERVHLPAERVVFPPPTERLGPAITTGLGLGTSGAGALVSGLTEVIERDATMLAWYSTFEPLGLAVDDPDFEQLTRRARSEDLGVTTLLVTQDIDVPVVTVAVHRDGDWPRFAVGSGAALDPIVAARGALEEALQSWMELRGMGPENAAEEEPTVAEYADLPPAARSYIEVEERVPAADVGPAEPPTGAEALTALVDRVAAAGLDAYAARLTPRDVGQLGFEAVRLLVPQAQPLFTGDRFFGERARTVPRELGFRPRLDRPAHPYP